MSAPITPNLPIHLIVMGVSGSGKSTIGLALAKRLALPFIEGDFLHPAENLAKMSAGAPLEDDDRWPWLDVVAESLRQFSFGAVASCSALKRTYRDRLRVGVGSGLRFLFLTGHRDLLALRMASRKEHFMKATMLESQLATLELPTDENDIFVQDAGQSIDDIVEAALLACGCVEGIRPL